MNDTGRLRESLRLWIGERADRQIDDQTRIFEGGVLSSMDAVDLLLFIEDVTQEEIDLANVSPDAFASIDAIVAAFS